MTPERMRELDTMAFEMFADAYPHEAAELDWAAFVAYARRRGTAMTEEQLRECLERTAERVTGTMPTNSRSLRPPS